MTIGDNDIMVKSANWFCFNVNQVPRTLSVMVPVGWLSFDAPKIEVDRKQQTADSKQQTANSKQQTAASKKNMQFPQYALLHPLALAQ